jgi:hypothetical protein
VSVVLPSEGDAFANECEEPMIGDGDPVRVSTEIPQDLGRTTETMDSRISYGLSLSPAESGIRPISSVYSIESGLCLCYGVSVPYFLFGSHSW